MQIPKGLLIKTKWSGATNSRPYPVVLATCRRDTEFTWSAQFRVELGLGDDWNHYEAAKKLVGRYLQNLEIVARGYDRDGQYFIAAPNNG